MVNAQYLMSSAKNPAPILQVDQLRLHIPLFRGYLLRQRAGAVRILDGISFELHPGETLALVGESGCGKTSLAQAIVQLLRPTSGRVLYRGQDMAQLQGEPLRTTRRKLQILFQEARTALNPILPARETLAEALDLSDPARQNQRIFELVELVEFSPAWLSCTPAKLTDAQCQRLGLARALAAEPEVIVYDAPTRPDRAQSTLGVLRLLEKLQQSLSLSCVFLERAAGLAYLRADRIGVMYAGRLIELAPQEELYRHPLHPYSQALLAALPGVNGQRGENAVRLHGEAPRPGNLPGGCRFHPRCRFVQPVCLEADAEWRQASPGHWVACHMV
jgi:oligopeptide/dipeptide ABC transporter ATP-binding protein